MRCTPAAVLGQRQLALPRPVAPGRGWKGQEVAASAGKERPPERAGARERILATAYDLFSRHGPAAVGVDAIVARSGVAKMSLYRHFRSKDELVVAFLERRK